MQALEVKVLQRGTQHDALYGLAVEGSRAIAVGAFGRGYSSVDSGSTWTAVKFPLENTALLGVAMREGHCVAVGQSGAALWSADCAKWQAVDSTTTARLMSVSVNRRGLAYAVGAFGTILKSSDWGRTWQPQAVEWSKVTDDGAEPHLYDVHVGDDDEVTLVGEFELVLRAGSGGEGWKVLHKGQRSLFALTVMADKRIYVVGQSGALLTSPDGGVSWQSLNSGTNSILCGVYASTDGLMLTTGINTVELSRNGGQSWTPVGIPTLKNFWFQGVTAMGGVGKQRLLTVGAGGSIVEVGL